MAYTKAELGAEFRMPAKGIPPSFEAKVLRPADCFKESPDWLLTT